MNSNKPLIRPLDNEGVADIRNYDSDIIAEITIHPSGSFLPNRVEVLSVNTPEDIITAETAADLPCPIKHDLTRFADYLLDTLTLNFFSDTCDEIVETRLTITPGRNISVTQFG